MDAAGRQWLWRVWGLVCALAAPAVAAAGTMTVETWAVGKDGPHGGTVEVLDAKGAAGVIRVDLSALPAGAKVHRARLLVARDAPDPKSAESLLARNEVCALAAPWRAGAAPQPAGKPLAIAPPAHDCFDATDAVRAAAGKRCELLVKSLPRWVRASTRLEIAYEGRPARVPKQAAGLAVFHRAGQTFITWKEVDPLITGEKATWGEIRKKLAAAPAAVSYRIYAHDRPIDAETISQAQPIARVGPLSGYNCNGRNMEYLIGQAMIKSDEMGELARGHNSYMYTWGMNSKRMDRCPVERLAIDEKAGRLPVGTGLYVHHPAAAAKRYYAVVSCKAGRENTADFSPATSLAEAVAETVGVGEPVCQGPGLWGPYFDYPGRRQVYVQWCAPPLCPRPSMYFNWSVLVPPGAAAGRKAQCELYFHTGNFSYAKPRKKFIRESVQIAGHDWPFTGWYGFNDAWGTLRSHRDGVVSNHTQKRIVAFLDWAIRKLPVDPERIFLPGGDGAVMLALSYPSKFSYVLVIDFDEYAVRPGREGMLPVTWGPKGPQVTDDRGRHSWGWAMLDEVVAAQRARDLPMIFCRGYSWAPFVRGFARGKGRFYEAMRKANQPIIADWTWAQGYLVPPDEYTGLWRGLDVTRTTPVPAFANCSTDSNKEGNGQTNLPMTWRPIEETPDGLRVAIANTRSGTVDVAFRRLGKFKPKPGQKLTWRAVGAAQKGRRVKPTAPQSGTVAVDDDGVFVLKAVQAPHGVDLTVSVARAK